MKVRITIDCSGSGTNGAVYWPLLSTPDSAETLRRVKQNCFMSKGDASGYFPTFPITKEIPEFWSWGLRGGRLFPVHVGSHGFTACSYYAPTWSAEFRRWFVEAGSGPAFLMDDWFSNWCNVREGPASHEDPARNIYYRQVTIWRRTNSKWAGPWYSSASLLTARL
jgi:hypothetical protein